MLAPREKADFKKRLGEVPHKPGVYLHCDRFGRVIYVGKARDLRKRLAQYFSLARANFKMSYVCLGRPALRTSR